MQAILEVPFDVGYLIVVIVLGILMVKNSQGRKQYWLFGITAVVLGAGDAFHLIPRVIALSTTGLENYTVALGLGRFVTSITMTLFYVLLYHVWRERYSIEGARGLTGTVHLLAVIRIVLCLFPQNAWTSVDPPLAWGIYRNIPFAVLGLLVAVLFYNSVRHMKDRSFKFMWLAIVLSFGFYIPVVLVADVYPLVGALMIPKTIAYVWAVWIGFSSMRKQPAAELSPNSKDAEDAEG
jgi:hypothetical protein